MSKGRGFSGKGGGKTKEYKEGFGRGKVKRDISTIESLTPYGKIDTSKTTEFMEFGEEEALVYQSEPNTNRLARNSSIFHGLDADIYELMDDLRNVGSSAIVDKHLEIEVRLLHGVDPRDADKFYRVSEWLKNIWEKSKLDPIIPLVFEERNYDIQPPELKNLYTVNIIFRGPDSHIKIKKHNKAFIGLPSIINIVPRIGISMESTSFKYNTTDILFSKSHRTRWRYPINSNTASILGINFGQLIYESTEEVKKSPGEDIIEISKGWIDLTITKTSAGTLTYSIEIEIDSSTIVHSKKYREIQMFANQPASVSERQGAALSKSQFELLDSWVKILATIINKTGIFMVGEEKNFIEREFNSYLGIEVVEIPTYILNKPKDLDKRDLSWLSPDKSEVFMSLGNYDLPTENNLNKLKYQGIHIPIFSIPGGFYASLKADGTRYLLFFSEHGIFLINPPSRILTKLTGHGTDSPYLRNIITGTILDTEIIGDFGPDGKLDIYKILVFDILCHNKVDVRSNTYTSRLKIIQEVVQSLNNNDLIISAVSANRELDMKNPKYKEKEIIKSYDSMFVIKSKPVYKLPSLSDIPEDYENKIITEKILLAKSLSNDFFKKIGLLVGMTMSSMNPDINSFLAENSAIKYNPQNTDGVLWDTDGLIFTPADRPYLETGDVFHQRIRDENYSLVKKYKLQMTIEFSIKRDEFENLAPVCYSYKDKKEVVFNSTRYPWNGNIELTDYMEGRIFEFRYGYSKIFDDYAFIPIKERSDRVTGNPLNVADDIWSLINDPITIDDITGQTLMTMRRYHNRVKTALLAELVDNFKGYSPVLLDIGSGRGGDMDKWNGFSKIYAVEPDEVNLREFIMRKNNKPTFDYSLVSKLKSGNLENFTMDKGNHYGVAKSIFNRSKTDETEIFKTRKQETIRSNIVLINTAGEDKQTLINSVPIGKVNCVTMFNALTFFYENYEKLNSLLNTVKTLLREGGYFYIIALDGEALLNSMRKRQTPNLDIDINQIIEGEIPTYNSLKTKNITIEKASDPSCRKIWIKIEGGIVRGQYEYLINIKEFIEIMDLNGFRLLSERYLDEEYFLSDESYWFSSMFKVLKFRFFSGPIKINLEKFLNPIVEKMEGNYVIRPLEPHEQPMKIKSTSLSSLGIGQLLRYGTHQDGSCYVHGTLRAFSIPYKNSTIAEKEIFVANIRMEMAEKYTKEIHEQTGNGFFRDSQLPAFTYENVKSGLGDAKTYVSHHLMEYIGDVLNVNVYILRGLDAQIYVFGSTASHIKPGRKNIILYWINDNHYETVGLLENNNNVRLVFGDDHPLIKAFSQAYASIK